MIRACLTSTKICWNKFRQGTVLEGLATLEALVKAKVGGQGGGDKKVTPRPAQGQPESLPAPEDGNKASAVKSKMQAKPQARPGKVKALVAKFEGTEKDKNKKR
jgi:hypothetical protein